MVVTAVIEALTHSWDSDFVFMHGWDSTAVVGALGHTVDASPESPRLATRLQDPEHSHAPSAALAHAVGTTRAQAPDSRRLAHARKGHMQERNQVVELQGQEGNSRVKTSGGGSSVAGAGRGAVPLCSTVLRLSAVA
jgi:hypothetical protein